MSNKAIISRAKRVLRKAGFEDQEFDFFVDQGAVRVRLTDDDTPPIYLEDRGRQIGDALRAAGLSLHWWGREDDGRSLADGVPMYLVES
jgi:hypothetical protein